MTTLTPTRGDRSALVNNCINQMRDQTKRPDKMIVVDYPPKSKAVDLTQRIFKGVTAITDDFTAIIEDDDYYPPNYIEVVTNKLKTHEVVGFDFSYYYHVKTNRWERLRHHGRSSLFCTSFRTYCLDGFNWPQDDFLFLDIKLWQHFNQKRYKIGWITEEECCPIGIKHGIGKTGGKGHTHSQSFRNADPNWEWLKSKVGDVEFYKGL